MILRLSISAERVVILAGAALLICFFSIRSPWAAHSAAQGLQRATGLEPGNAEYWDLLGRHWQFNLGAPDGQKAIAAYQNSLWFDPRSAKTYIDLATAYEGIDDIANARDKKSSAKP
jgi:hypothetical protein